MTDNGDRAMEAAEAAVKAGQPSVAGAILAADALGIDIKDPRVLEAAWYASVSLRRGAGTDRRTPGSVDSKKGTDEPQPPQQ